MVKLIRKIIKIIVRKIAEIETDLSVAVCNRFYILIVLFPFY